MLIYPLPPPGPHPRVQKIRGASNQVTAVLGSLRGCKWADEYYIPPMFDIQAMTNVCNFEYLRFQGTPTMEGGMRAPANETLIGGGYIPL